MFVAFDLGAGSGRAFAGSVADGRVVLRELHRFSNTPVRTVNTSHWDVLSLFREIEASLALAAQENERVESIGVDSWGADFALLDRDGVLVSNPYTYRDPRTEGMIERAQDRVPAEEIYRETGIQFIRLNTVYQLLAMEGSTLLEAADTLLMIPDLIAYWLTGERYCEFTNATTTQLYSPLREDWAWNLIKSLGLPQGLFPEIIPSAREVGKLLPGVAHEAGLEEVPVTAVASHDTASAVVAVPARTKEFAYISSGTWSLVGVETNAPVISEEALQANFTNEGGFGGRTRVLKNVMGLWLLQECKREWDRKTVPSSYEELIRAAAEAPQGGPLIDPDHSSFLHPGDMPGRIRSFCRATEQRLPETVGESVRCVLESLAFKYRRVLEQVREVTGQRIEVVHVVGGGSQNELLCDLTAEVSGIPVRAGPVEATALGNVMVQAYAAGYVRSLDEIRNVVGRSFGVRTHEPGRVPGPWEEMYGRFMRILDADPAGIREEGEIENG